MLDAKSSAIKYFFSANPDQDFRGMQFWTALQKGTLDKFVQVSNFVSDPNIQTLELWSDDVHPEIVKFLVDLGNFHRSVFSPRAMNLQEQIDMNGPGKLLVENVVKKYSTLDPTEKTFYREFVQLIQRGPETQTAIATKNLDELMSSDNLADWQLNLLVSQKIERMAPMPAGMPRTTIFLEKMTEASIMVRMPGSLDSLKKENLSRLNFPISIPTFYMWGYSDLLHSNEKYSNKFSIDLTDFIRRLLKETAVEDDGKNLPDSPLLDFLDFTTGDIISVKDGAFVKKEGLKTVPIEITANNCYTTQIQGTPLDCHKLMSELIFNDDAEAVNKYFSSFNDNIFALKAKEDITKIAPELAVKILKKFGFTVHEENINGRKIKKFCSIYTWMKNLQGMGLNPTTIQSIQQARHFKTYLGLLVEFVNSNPVILNSGITDAKIEPEQIDPLSYLGRINIQMIPHIPIGETVHDTHSALLQIATNAKMAQRLLALPASTPFPFPVIRLPGMVGGNPEGSEMLRSIIHNLIADLNRKGKKLRQSDIQTIDKHLDTLRHLEKSLMKVSQQLREFKDWITLFPDDKQNVVSIGSISESIAKYRETREHYAKLELGVLNVAVQLGKMY